jgi:hypothetical protein
MHFSAACNWAVRSGLISHNPFRGMSEEIKIPKAKNEENDIGVKQRNAKFTVASTLKPLQSLDFSRQFSLRQKPQKS